MEGDDGGGRRYEINGNEKKYDKNIKGWIKNPTFSPTLEAQRGSISSPQGHRTPQGQGPLHPPLTPKLCSPLCSQLEPFKPRRDQLLSLMQIPPYLPNRYPNYQLATLQVWFPLVPSVEHKVDLRDLSPALWHLQHLQVRCPFPDNFPQMLTLAASVDKKKIG